MGGPRGLYPLVRPVKKPLADFDWPAKTYAFVDASCEIHRLHARWPRLASAIFELSPMEERMGGMAKLYAMALLQQVPRLDGHAVEWVFKHRPAKRGAVDRVKRRARNLQHGVRNSYLSTSPGAKANGRRTIASAMGRPPWWFTTLVIQELRQGGVNVCP